MYRQFGIQIFFSRVHPSVLTSLCHAFFGRPNEGKEEQKSIDDGQIQDDWQDAHITAIFKKGNKAEPGNYRGVSLTSD